ncbi:hypothetical protein V5F77_02450 [Xanthobacter sp. DSM 24535]|uniref:hypothetical protein n=1 Tax=Roseixanthobacter psychrophilus TaxID=3119917 RepID=UPI00372673F2
MSELRALRDRTADRLIAAGIIPTVIRAPWLPVTAEQLPALAITARRARLESEGRANLGAPSFLARATIMIVMRRTADDGELLENALLADETAIIESLLNDADWLAGVEAVETVETTLRQGAENELTLFDLSIEITATWRMDYGATGTDLTSIRGRLTQDGPDVFGADHLDQ